MGHGRVKFKMGIGVRDIVMLRDRDRIRVPVMIRGPF